MWACPRRSFKEKRLLSKKDVISQPFLISPPLSPPEPYKLFVKKVIEGQDVFFLPFLEEKVKKQ